MNKETYLKKYNLINEYYKRYTLNEAGGIPDPTMGGDGQDMSMDDNTMGNDPMGGAPNMGNDTNAMNGGMPDNSMGDTNTMGGDPNMDMSNDPMDGGNAGAEGFQPQGPEPQDPNMYQAPMGSEEEEEVIDVDDLTDSQEDTERKVDSLTSKFDKLLDMVSQFEERIELSNSHIDDLKKELEKRNPMPIEKMSLRSKTGYPFNVSPDEYWEDKEATSNYSRDDDQNGVNQQQYTITKNDVDNMTDWASISKSLDDEGLFANLRDILDF